MSALRLKGVVRAMNHARSRLAAGIPAAEQAQFRAHVTGTVVEVERLCRAHGTTPDRLPAATAAAYRYLKGLDLAHIPEPTGPTPVALRPTRVPGLIAFTETIRDDLRRLAGASAPDRAAGLAPLVTGIQGRLEQLEAAAQRGDFDLGTLPGPSRRAHQWLGWLTQLANAERQLEALALLAERGQAARGHAGRPRASRGLSVEVDLYHTSVLYRTRHAPDGLEVTAAQLFVGAPEDVLAALVLAAAGVRADGSLTLLRAYAAGDEAAELMLDLELAGAPPVALTRGRHHDLAASFARVNSRHFGGRLSPPKLTWSRVHTRRKMGHYQPLTDTVLVSISLDDRQVPADVVDFVMYHELLHRVLGVEVAGGRHLAHGPAFRAAERRYPGYEQAQAFLDRGGSG